MQISEIRGVSEARRTIIYHRIIARAREAMSEADLIQLRDQAAARLESAGMHQLANRMRSRSATEPSAMIDGMIFEML